MNKIVYVDLPKKEYYNFITENYPWNWGNYEQFMWKHCKDPYNNEKSFYMIKEQEKICSLGVGNVYPFFYKNKSINVLMMMDFVTCTEYQKKGLINHISNYIVECVDADIAIGFTSRYLYENIYKEKSILQKFYLHQFNESIGRIGCEIVNDSNMICEKLNSNINSFQRKRDEQYLHYIKENPKYEKVFYIRNGELLVGIGLKHNIARIIEISEYSIDTCMQAIQMALNFATEILIDFPCECKRYNSKILKETYVIMNKIKTDICIEGDKNIWIPVVERK